MKKLFLSNLCYQNWFKIGLTDQKKKKLISMYSGTYYVILPKDIEMTESAVRKRNHINFDQGMVILNEDNNSEIQ